jgi:hypothetical protein
MKIILSPQRRDEALTVYKQGDVLTVNGEEFDFSTMVEGDMLPAEAISSIWFVDKVERVEGELVITLLLPIPHNYSPEQAFPAPLLNVPDGEVMFPQPLPEVPEEEV